MRVVVSLELEIADGQRGGTAVIRAVTVAESLASWAARLRPVTSVHAVTIHPADRAASLGAPMISVPPTEAWRPEDFTDRVARAKHTATKRGH
jgi:hypothetical protein